MLPCSHPSSTNEDIYVNRKGFNTFNIQVICDHEFHFINAVVKLPGCTCYSFIWSLSGINHKITSGKIGTVHEGYLGDSAYGTRSFLFNDSLLQQLHLGKEGYCFLLSSPNH